MLDLWIAGCEQLLRSLVAIDLTVEH